MEGVQGKERTDELFLTPLVLRPTLSLSSADSLKSFRANRSLGTLLLRSFLFDRNNSASTAENSFQPGLKALDFPLDLGGFAESGCGDVRQEIVAHADESANKRWECQLSR